MLRIGLLCALVLLVPAGARADPVKPAAAAPDSAAAVPAASSPAPKCTYPDTMEVPLSFEALMTIGAALSLNDFGVKEQARALAQVNQAVVDLNKRYCK